MIPIPQPAGMGSFSIAIPDLPDHIGLTIYLQALLMSSEFEGRLSNVVPDTLIR